MEVKDTPCVYMHFAPNGECFYIGKAKSKDSRPFSKNKSTRSKKWWAVFTTLCGQDKKKVKVKIISTKTEGEALKLEFDLIQKHKPIANIQYAPVAEGESSFVMKTDNMMEVKIGSSFFHIDYKTRFGSLQEFWAVGNKYRVDEGLPVKRMADWLNNPSTKEFIKKVSSEIGTPATFAKMGRNGGTGAHLYILLDAAVFLSTNFKFEVYKTFVEDNIFGWRDESGDHFITMNDVLSNHATAVLGKPAHKGHYIQVARLMNKKILGDTGLSWNMATAEHLMKRAEYEKSISSFLAMGLVKDWEHLKQLIEKL